MSNLRTTDTDGIGRARAAVAVGEVEDAVGDVAAERLVEHERRRHVGALIAGVLDADPARRVHRAVVVDERDPGVVGLHVLRDAAVRHDDDVARRVVRAALGRVDRAVDLHVRRHRVELAVRRRIDRHAQPVADEVGLRPCRRRLAARPAGPLSVRSAAPSRSPSTKLVVSCAVSPCGGLITMSPEWLTPNSQLPRGAVAVLEVGGLGDWELASVS